MVFGCRKLCSMKVVYMLEFLLYTRFVFDGNFPCLLSVVVFRFRFLIALSFQVERGKHVYYCYDDAELKKLQSSFPSNASYNIQRFKGMSCKYYLLIYVC